MLSAKWGTAIKNRPASDRKGDCSPRNDYKDPRDAEDFELSGRGREGCRNDCLWCPPGQLKTDWTKPRANDSGMGVWMLDAELRGVGTDGLCERRRRLRKRIVEQRL